MDGKHQGFTLLELMIVVAIIGILAGIAVPQYKNYVIRADIAELLSYTAVPKSALVEYYAVYGEMPSTADDGGFDEIATDSGLSLIWSLSYLYGDADQATIRVIHRHWDRDAGAYAGSYGIDVIAYGDATGVRFECGSAGDGLGITHTQLPSTCRDF